MPTDRMCVHVVALKNKVFGNVSVICLKMLLRVIVLTV